jgi:hypothetical protein
MMKKICLLVSAIAFLSCKNFSQSRVSAAKPFDVAACFSKTSATVGKVDCLNQWVKSDLLPQAARDLQSVSAAGVPLSYYSVAVCGPHYFDERPKWLPAQADIAGVWTDLDSRRQRELFEKQIRSTVEFLKIVHKSMRGVPNGWFKDVVVCPRKLLDNRKAPPLKLVSGTLFIWTRENVGGYEVMREDEILSRWNSMDFESDVSEMAKSMNSLFSNKAQKIWGILNPIGSVRTAGRTVLFDKLSHVLKQLDGVISGESGSAAASNSGAPRALSLAEPSHALAGVLSSMALDSSQDALRHAVSALNVGEAEARCLAKMVATRLRDTGTWQAQEGCTNTILSRQIRNSVNVQDVGIYVGNLHSIAVSLASCEPRMEAHAVREKDVFEQSVNIKRVGVAVHTVDDIRVAVNAFVFPAVLDEMLSRAGECGVATR